MFIQDWNGGKIDRTANGNYVFEKNGQRSTEYPSVARLVHDVKRSDAKAAKERKIAVKEEAESHGEEVAVEPKKPAKRKRKAKKQEAPVVEAPTDEVVDK